MHNLVARHKENRIFSTTAYEMNLFTFIVPIKVSVHFPLSLQSIRYILCFYCWCLRNVKLDFAFRDIHIVWGKLKVGCALVWFGLKSNCICSQSGQQLYSILFSIFSLIHSTCPSTSDQDRINFDKYLTNCQILFWQPEIFCHQSTCTTTPYFDKMSIYKYW